MGPNAPMYTDDDYERAPWTFNHELLLCGFAFPLGSYAAMLYMWTYAFGHPAGAWTLAFWAALIAAIAVSVGLATNSMHNIRRTAVVKDGECIIFEY